MSKYVFVKDVSMGFIKKSAKSGQTVDIGKNYVIFQNEKISDLRDFEILKKYKIIVPANEIKNSISKGNDKQVKTNKFGFEVKKEAEETNIIPLDKFTKATELDETKKFVQEDGIIQNEQSEIHTATEDEKIQIEIDGQKNEKEDVKVSKKNTPKKSNSKKTKSSKESFVRGMKIIKES